MTMSEKQELVRLLHLYMDDIVDSNKENIYKARQIKKVGGSVYDGNYKTGLKAQYEHARILATKLSVEVNGSIKTWWEL